MLWWSGVVFAGIAAFRFWEQNRGLAWVAVVVGIAGLWTAGIAHNFQRGEEQAIPGAAAAVNIASALGALVLLVISFVIS